jgi:Spy/CpxP family protein refolding chaperone
MKNSLKFVSLLAGLVLLASPVVRAADAAADAPNAPAAQGPGGGKGGPGAMLERAKKQLNLTADQEAKWKAIAEAERAAVADLRADTSVAREDRRAKMMELNKGFADQRRAVLNAEQQAKFDEMRAKMMERGPGGPGGKEGKRKKGQEN